MVVFPSPNISEGLFNNSHVDDDVLFDECYIRMWSTNIEGIIDTGNQTDNGYKWRQLIFVIWIFPPIGKYWWWGEEKNSNLSYSYTIAT